MANKIETQTRVKKSDLAGLKAGQVLSTRFGLVELNHDGDGSQQNFSVTVIEAHEGRAENGEVLFLRYTKLSFVEVIHELELEDMIQEVEVVTELTACQEMYSEACHPGTIFDPETTVTKEWSIVDRIAAGSLVASMVAIHLLLVSLW